MQGSLILGPLEGIAKPVRRIACDSPVVNSLREFTTVLDSSMVEHAAVNRGVVGSSPTRGVDKKPVNVKVCGDKEVISD